MGESSLIGSAYALGEAMREIWKAYQRCPSIQTAVQVHRIESVK